MNLLRVTVIDRRGGVSFIAHGDALPAFTKACSYYPETLEDLLSHADGYYASLRDYVLSGLAVFDEHNVPGRWESIHGDLAAQPRYEKPVFRVVDDITREESLRPVGAGAVIFNLPERRVVQIQNTYREIRREGRAQVYDGDRWTGEVFPYQLPSDWALVP